MPPRATISNGIITVVILFFMLMLAMVLKARYRLGSQEKAETAAVENEVPKAIPVAMPVEMKVHEARAYKQGDWWVLPKPELVVSRANEADTLRIRSGPKEDVFVLYFVDSAEVSWSKPHRIREQSAYFQKISQQRVVDMGSEALNWVTNLLTKNEFIIYTKWEQVPDTERFYALVQVKTAPDQAPDLGELLVRKGFASLTGYKIDTLPEGMVTQQNYATSLSRALTRAKVDRVGAWAEVPE